MGHLSNLLYLDSSVFGGVFDEEFAEHTEPLFSMIDDGTFRLAISVAVASELSLAPARVRRLFERQSSTATILRVTEECNLLQQAYLKAGIVTEKYQTDALHVAIASAGSCRAIVSWNFKHIVHMDRIRLYNAVNQLLGYNDLSIHTPPELLKDEALP